VVLVTGALDEKYTAIAREEAPPVANVRVHVLGGAGHALHLEQPDALADVLAS